jgi:hypothetical protein
LLAALGAELFVYLREVRGMPLQRLKDGWRELVLRSLPVAELR